MFLNTQDRRPGLVLAAAATVQFMVSLDFSVVNVGLPRIGAGLSFSPAGLTWVIHAYALTFGGLLLLGGKIADRFGRGRVLLLGLVAFGLASLAGGFAQEPSQLVTARAVQGIGAAAAAPAALALLTAAFPSGRARVRAFGIWAATNAAGGALGVLAGGVLTQYAGWRWVMFVSAPMAAIALALAWPVADDHEVRSKGRPDVLGALLATGGLGLLVFGVVRTGQHGWTTPATLSTLAIAAVLLIAFVLVERRTVSDPLIRMGLLANRSVAGANAYNLLVGAAMAAAFYFASLYLQHVLGVGPALAGVEFLPFALGVAAGSVLAIRLGYRVAPPADHRRAADRGRVRLVRADQRERYLSGRHPRAVDRREHRVRVLSRAGRLDRDRRSRAGRGRRRVRAAQQLAADRRVARAGSARHRRRASHRSVADAGRPDQRLRPRPDAGRRDPGRGRPHRGDGAARNPRRPD